MLEWRSTITAPSPMQTLVPLFCHHIIMLFQSFLCHWCYHNGILLSVREKRAQGNHKVGFNFRGQVSINWLSVQQSAISFPIPYLCLPFLLPHPHKTFIGFIFLIDSFHFGVASLPKPLGLNFPSFSSFHFPVLPCIYIPLSIPSSLIPPHFPPFSDQPSWKLAS